MAYTKVFTKPYASGYKDLPSQTTPITATTLNAKDTAITHIEEYLEDNPIGSDVEWNQITESGTKIAEITIGEEVTEVYAPTGGSGGNGASNAEEVSFDNTESSMEATNVQDAIDEVFQSVSNGKELIADAITDKGVTTSATDTFETMANNISNISGGTEISSKVYAVQSTSISTTSSGKTYSYTAPSDGMIIIAYLVYCNAGSYWSYVIKDSEGNVKSTKRDNRDAGDNKVDIVKPVYVKSGDIITMTFYEPNATSATKITPSIVFFS